MVWWILAGVFVYLLSRSLSAAQERTGSRLVAFGTTLLDGLAMIAFATGIFGLLMALIFGVLPDHGLRLVGQSLTQVLVWSGGLIAAGILLVVAGGGARRLGARFPVKAKPQGGH